VVVTARIEFTTYADIATAELYVDSGDGYQPIAMFDDGDHHDGAAGDSEYGTVIPPVSDLTSVSYYFYSSDDSSTTTYEPPSAPGSTSYGYVVGYDPPDLVINEILADNESCCPDEHGDYDGWLELYNNEPMDVDLTGMFLTNNLADPTRFEIGAVIIPAGGFVVFWADGETVEGPEHTSFVLVETGGSIGLFNSLARGNHELTSLSYGSQKTDVSIGRFPDGSLAWPPLAPPTPGTANSECDCTDHCDVNIAGGINPTDVVILVNHVYKSEDTRDQILTCSGDNGDWNCDGQVNPTDVVLIVNFVYKGLENDPCNPCVE